jgi:hypothetical protein
MPCIGQALQGLTLSDLQFFEKFWRETVNVLDLVMSTFSRISVTTEAMSLPSLGAAGECAANGQLHISDTQ